MNNNTNTQNLTGQLNDAVLNGYVRPIEIIKDWMSYRHPEYELNSASLQEGRFNLSGDPAFYLASGDYCWKFEVPNYYARIPCEIKPHTVYVFDAPSFSKDYGYNEAFVHKKKMADGNSAKRYLNIWLITTLLVGFSIRVLLYTKKENAATAS